MIKLDITHAVGACGHDINRKLGERAVKANELLHNGRGAGSDFLGWVNLPSSVTSEFIEDINTTAQNLRSKADVIIVIGIGGSYLGAKAVIEALGEPFSNLRCGKDPKIVFAGHNISEDYLYNLLEAVKELSIAAIVISKSGTTTETAIAFRIIRDEIEKRYGTQGARERIVAVTDSSKGALRQLSDKEGYKTYDIENNIGGRFSVLTAVGLLPIAAAGIDISELIRGAKEMELSTAMDVPYEKNISAQYAALRNLLYSEGYKTEILGSYEPQLSYLAEWWKQLFGESEGKEGKGIFPASVTYTADLHSMGQYIQEGERTLFETVISVTSPHNKLVIGSEDDDLDGLNFLAGKRLSEVNRMAELGTALAHTDGGVPNIRIEIESITPYHIGSLIYFFEKACGISAYLLGVNPFDQPGVEAYKKNMFALLDKPGYEKESEAIRERLKQ